MLSAASMQQRGLAASQAGEGGTKGALACQPGGPVKRLGGTPRALANIAEKAAWLA